MGVPGCKGWSPAVVFTYPTFKPLPRHKTAISINRFKEVAEISIAGYRAGVDGLGPIGDYTYHLCPDTLSSTSTIYDDQKAQIEAGIAIWADTVGFVTYEQREVTPCSDRIDNTVALRDPGGMHKYCDNRRGSACVMHEPKPEDVAGGAIETTSIHIAVAADTAERTAGGEDCSELFQLAMHEAGHVYGLGDASRSRSDIVMGGLWGRCSPSANDVVALKAIYQSSR